MLERKLGTATLILAAALWGLPQTGEGATAGSLQEDENEVERVENAVRVLEEIVRVEDKDIPNALLERARAVAVIPHVVKGAFVVGGRFGKGLVSKRIGEDMWGAPLFIEIGGGSVGFQIGGEATDLVLVFIEENGIDELLDDKVQIGADATVAAGPLGRGAEIGTNITLDSAIYAYSRSKGLFAGIALDGAVLSVDDSANQTVYGVDFDRREILESRAMPEIVKPFVDAIRRYTPAAPSD